MRPDGVARSAVGMPAGTHPGWTPVVANAGGAAKLCRPHAGTAPPVNNGEVFHPFPLSIDPSSIDVVLVAIHVEPVTDLVVRES